MRLRENSRSASAVATFLPRMSCARRLSFCGLTRSMRATALASLSESERSRAFLLMIPLPGSRFTGWRRRRGSRCGRRSTVTARRARPGSLAAAAAFCLAIRCVAVERTGRRELAELVTDHFLGDDDWNVFLAVVDA